MRACMVAYTFYETDNRVRRYAETLVKRGAEVDAIVLRRKGQKSYDLIEGVHVYRIQRRVINERSPIAYLLKLLTFFVLSAWVLTLRHLRARYDIIHVHSVPDFQVFSTLLPRLMGAKILLDIHDIVPELYASKFNITEHSLAFRVLVFIERLSCSYSHHVIIANHIWHERLVRRLGRPEHCTTILNYPDPSIFHRRPRTTRNGPEFVIFYPGTLSWHQGVDLIIFAIATLRNEDLNLRLLIIGDGAERERLLMLAKEHGIEDRVTIRSGIPIEQIANTMANVDLGVEPKRKQSFANEALSTKIPEFMAMGVPVLASDTKVHQYYFNDGMIEFFQSENVVDLADKIRELSRNPEKRDALCVRGSEFILGNNWDVKKYEYLDLVHSLVNWPSEQVMSAT